MRYAKPIGDNSGLIDDFDVTSEEQVDLLLSQLDYERLESEPVFVDAVVVGVKLEDDCICVRFKTKGKYDSFTFYLDNEGILLLQYHKNLNHQEIHDTYHVKVYNHLMIYRN